MMKICTIKLNSFQAFNIMVALDHYGYGNCAFPVLRDLWRDRVEKPLSYEGRHLRAFDLTDALLLDASED